MASAHGLIKASGKQSITAALWLSTATELCYTMLESIQVPGGFTAHKEEWSDSRTSPRLVDPYIMATVYCVA